MFCVHCVIHSKRTTTPPPARDRTPVGRHGRPRAAGTGGRNRQQGGGGAGCTVFADQCFGGHSGGETPGLIPNPEAKPSSADGTAPGRVWESRTPPDST